MAGSGRFLHHGSILLRDLVHLIDRGVDLVQGGRLLLRAERYVEDDGVDLADVQHDPFECVARFIH